MSDTPSTSSPRGRGRGKSRGGLGKYLRARGRGRGLGRPAQFTQRLLLEGEGPNEEEDEEEKEERNRKYSRRNLGSNVDRYKEEEVELDSDGEPILEPEIDLTAFLERQKLLLDDDDVLGDLAHKTDEEAEDDIDHSMDHISSSSFGVPRPVKKGKVETIEWSTELEELARDKAVADANRELKTRLKSKINRLQRKPVAPSKKQSATKVDNAPALPSEEVKKPKEEMEDFLDDLLG